ncbi:MAG TPA: PEP/pyruvate-binding domain-containing protein, partial [Gammaproteobacteria bacterium]|nr:PEP/pyruvate-binding domain-containing protein [Gammaproteobacteria bacterium]
MNHKVKTRKRIYYFSREHTDGNKDMKSLLGGKGANLAEMTSIGLPVPPGFTIDTRTCAEFLDAGRSLPAKLMDQVKKNITRLEKQTGKGFSNSAMPLLISVRSGAAISMPGMMDTVLNLGLNDKSVEGLADATNNLRFALDAYRRLINMYADVVMGVSHEHFETALEKIKKRHGADSDTDLDENALSEVIAAYKKVYRKHTKSSFPQDPRLQLELAIKAVFASWSTPRAVEYRRIHEITGLHGTAVNIQSMVFGNM